LSTGPGAPQLPLTQKSYKKAMEIYSTRWTIEVFFKEAKQLLGLGQMSIHEF
jgi:hypothetical protein